MADVRNLLAEINERYKGDKGPAPIWENELTYDSSVETLEPIYYWLLDFVKGAYNVRKLEDNFTASPGSSYFADLTSRATKMQEEGMKILGAVNIVIKSIMNILYDLKEFDIRLENYVNEGSNDPQLKQAGMLALKDIWMSNVDMKRGRGSINQMTYELGFTTLRDAFMKAESVDEAEKIDVNDRVKRVLKPRIAEFLEWKDRSHDELTRRFEIERSYLKSQLTTLKLYSSWVKPYLKAAEQLRMKDSKDASIVSIFGTMALNLSLMLTRKVNVADEVDGKSLPEELKKARDIRQFYHLIFLDYSFRTYPTQQFPHAGIVTINFKAYAVNDDELLLLNKKLDKDEETSLLGLAGDLSEETLKQLEGEIYYYTKREQEEKKKKEEEKKKREGSAFSGVFKDFMETFFPPAGKKISLKDIEDKQKEEKRKKAEEEDERFKKFETEGIKKDNTHEDIVRDLAELQASDFCFKIFDIFKKSRGMASFPSPFDEPDVYKRLRERRAEITTLRRGAERGEKEEPWWQAKEKEKKEEEE